MCDVGEMALRAIFCYCDPTMEKTFKSCDRKQMLLLPPSLLDWLPEGHLAHFILDVVEQLDLSRIYASYLANRRDSHAGYRYPASSKHYGQRWQTAPPARS